MENLNDILGNNIHDTSIEPIENFKLAENLNE
jgi:hypothetical protein